MQVHQFEDDTSLQCKVLHWVFQTLALKKIKTQELNEGTQSAAQVVILTMLSKNEDKMCIFNLNYILGMGLRHRCGIGGPRGSDPSLRLEIWAEPPS